MWIESIGEVRHCPEKPVDCLNSGLDEILANPICGWILDVFIHDRVAFKKVVMQHCIFLWRWGEWSTQQLPDEPGRLCLRELESSKACGLRIVNGGHGASTCSVNAPD
jgi:hypothetical protein